MVESSNGVYSFKDSYEEELKKRDFKTKLGNLMYEYAVTSKLVLEYQKQLSAVNEKIDAVIKEISENENS